MVQEYDILVNLEKNGKTSRVTINPYLSGLLYTESSAYKTQQMRSYGQEADSQIISSTVCERLWELPESFYSDPLLRARTYVGDTQVASIGGRIWHVLQSSAWNTL